MRVRATAVAALVLALPLTACGNGDDEKEAARRAAHDKEAAQAVSQDLQKGGQGGMDLEKADADCVGKDLVEELGTAKLVEYKVITKDNKPVEGEAAGMSTKDAGTTAGVFQGCVDVRSMFFSELPKEIPAQARKCLEEKVTDQVIGDALEASFSGDDQGAQKAIGEAVMACQQAG